MYDYGTFTFESKTEVLERAKTFWNPDKTQFWTDAGVDLVIDRREDYFLWDMSGRRLIDMHLNGGTYSIGHRNPEVMQALSEGMQHFDVGNHHFPSVARTALAERLVDSAPDSITKVAFGSGGGEAIDIATQERSARHPASQNRLDHQGLPRPHRAGSGHRGRPVLQDVPLRPSRRVRARAVR